MATDPVLGSSQGGVVFLQKRVARFGLVAGGLLLFVLVCRAGLALASGRTRAFTHPSFLLHLAAALSLLLVWLACRGRRCSRRFVRVVEFGGLLGASLALGAMGTFLPPAASPGMIVLFALALGVLARAVYVPSTARATVLLCVVLGLPAIASAYLSHRRIDVEWWRAGGGPMLGAGPEGVAALGALAAAFWWTAVTALCGAASGVLYGLRRAVHQAEQLGQYTLEEKLGEGAMGMVFRARHAMLRRPTAVKLLLPDKVGDEETLARFEREVQLTARLTHPHTVTIFDYGRTPDGIFYYAMELLEGASLDTIVDVGGAQPPERVLYIMDQVAAALSEAHGVGLIHRDIKPANIILTQQGGEPDVAKVVDFGLVKDTRSGGDAALSRSDAVAGTPRYMSPETIIAYHQVDARSDLYSLGAVAYFLLTGEHVFDGATAGEVVTKHVHEEPIPPSHRLAARIPADLERIILACLAKEPDRRPQSANHLRARLWACESRGKWNTDRARRWWREHGEEVRARHRPERTIEKTIAIDIRAHAQHQSP